jgi:hypothetical protein
MEVHFSPDLQIKLANFAARQGRDPDALLQHVVTEYLAEAERLLEAPGNGGGTLPLGATPELPVRHLGDVGSLHRRDIYNDR